MELEQSAISSGCSIANLFFAGHQVSTLDSRHDYYIYRALVCVMIEKDGQNRLRLRAG